MLTRFVRSGSMHETRPVRETETLGGLPPSVFFFVTQMSGTVGFRGNVFLVVRRGISSELTIILYSFSGVEVRASRMVGKRFDVFRPPVATRHGWFFISAPNFHVVQRVVTPLVAVGLRQTKSLGRRSSIRGDAANMKRSRRRL